MKNVLKTTIIAVATAAALTGCQKPKPIEPVKLAAPAPEVATVGIDNATLIWEAVEDAASYEILIDDEKTVPVSGVSATLEDLIAGTRYSVKMRSIAPDGSKTLLDSDYGEAVEFTTKGKGTLDAPVLSTKDLGPDVFTLYWTAVKNAEKYIYVFNGGAEKETTETSVTFEGLTYATDYAVKVKAVPTAKAASTTLESAWSEKTVKTADRAALDAPVLTSSDVNTNGFKLSWAAISNAASYKYKLDGGEVKTTTDLNVVFTGLTAKTQYTIDVCASPAGKDGGKYVDSQWSQIKVTTNDLVVLATPVLKAENVLAEEFTVTWAVVEHAAAYMVSFNGGAAEKVAATSSRFTGLSTETKFAVEVYAIPADVDKVTYKDSQVARIEVTTKAGPSADDKGGNISDFDEISIF